MGNQSLGNYTTVQKIGKGIYGKTRLSESADHYSLAIKIYEVTDSIHLSTVMNKSRVHLNFESKHVAKIRDIFQIDDSRFGIAMNYYPQGNLANNLKIKTVRQTLLDMKELAQAVRYLHVERKIPHGNIKPENIFVSDQSLVMSDIGCPLTYYLRLRKILGGNDYRPRQSYEESSGGSFASDIWSLGVVFIELIFGKRIRQLEGLQGIQHPSLVREDYPSISLLNSISDQNLQYLLKKMVDSFPLQRMSITEVIEYISKFISNQQISDILESPIRPLAPDSQKVLESIRQFAVVFDRQHPCYQKFRFIKNCISRFDKELVRYQAVARQCIPTGKWKVTFRIINYGSQNEAVVFGILSQERRKELMSGDVDQYHSVALWTNRTNKISNLCENGVWKSNYLPFLRQKQGLLQMVIDTVDREIQWWIDGVCVAESTLAHGFWSEEYYVFVGLRGQNCEVQMGQEKVYR